MKWNAIYKRISMNDGPERGSVSVLNQWENEGKKVTKWELSRVIKELRKFRRYKLAFEVPNQLKFEAFCFFFLIYSLLCVIWLNCA